jgi:diaminopimelate epimerase
MEFYKYHGLGNDYIVIDPEAFTGELTPALIRTLCHRNFGVGSDGILLGPIRTKETPFFLRIFNPDGSEAEKSGNGLRIFSRYLWDKKRIDHRPVSILTKGGMVQATVLDGGRAVTVEMGRVSFNSVDIPVTGPPRETLNEPLEIGGERFFFHAATIGNPHCVILRDQISAQEAKRLGPFIESHPFFPNKINVQFMRIIDRKTIAIEIWERGAGYTLASGSSSCASAAVAHKLGLCDSDIVVNMPGGAMEIHLAKDYSIRMTGAVVKIAEGFVSPEIFDTPPPLSS